MPVYAFRKSATNQVKIGVSVNVSKRLTTLQHAAGAELTILHQVESDAPYTVERELHLLYHPKRSRYGEWFVIPEVQEIELKGNMDRLAAQSSKAIGPGTTSKEDEFSWLREPLAHAFAASLLTPEKLASIAHVRPADVDRILFGKTKLTHAKVMRVARALRIDLLAVTSDSRAIEPFEPETPDVDVILNRVFGSH